eukprot:3902243-Prymnesium_polylepis.1
MILMIILIMIDRCHRIIGVLALCCKPCCARRSCGRAPRFADGTAGCSPSGRRARRTSFAASRIPISSSTSTRPARGAGACARH